MLTTKPKTMKKAIAAAAITLGITASVPLLSPGPRDVRPLIVQGESIEAVTRAIAAVGGEITHDLHIINAVGANLSQEQFRAVQDMPGIRRVHGDGTVKTASIEDGTLPYLDFPSLVQADDLHPMGVDGRDV